MKAEAASDMRRKKVTLHDLADKLGLSVQTVSKALSGKPGMSEQTRSDVFRHARELGYLTKAQTNAFAYERISPYPIVQRRFVLLHTEQSLNFNRLLLDGLHDRFTEFGHRVDPVLIPAELQPDDFAEWAETAGIGFAEGVFIAPRMASERLERLLLALPVPRILLNFPPHEVNVDSVIWDVGEAVYQSVMHLRKLGHSRILYVGDIGAQRGFRLRWQTFRDAIEGGSEAAAPTVRLPLLAYVPEQVKFDARAFIDRYRELQPSAILCAIDELAVPVYRALTDAGVRVPADCSLIGIVNEQTDDLPLLTRPLLLIKECGFRAADRMLWRIANPSAPYEHIRVRGGFYAGSTTSPYTAND